MGQYNCVNIVDEVKVELVFNSLNIPDRALDDEAKQVMIDLAKNAKGFCFFTINGQTIGGMIRALSSLELAMVINSIYEAHPEAESMVNLLRVIKPDVDKILEKKESVPRDPFSKLLESMKKGDKSILDKLKGRGVDPTILFAATVICRTSVRPRREGGDA